MDIHPIGYLHSDFESRFGAPRQPGIVPEARAELHLHPPYNNPEALSGLEGCTHIWLIVGFHATPDRPWRPTVRPPRLGGNQRCGVFATRSPFRPNHLGLSLVRQIGLLAPPACGLALSGVDLIDGTPVYDIKPYLPDIEAPTDAQPPDLMRTALPGLRVEWRASALAQLETAPAELKALITATIAADPRPAYRRGQDAAHFGMRLAGYEVAWSVADETAWVESVSPAPGKASKGR